MGTWGFTPQGKPWGQGRPHASEMSQVRVEQAGALIHPLPQSVVEGCSQGVLLAWNLWPACVARSFCDRKVFRQRSASDMHRSKCCGKMDCDFQSLFQTKSWISNLFKILTSSSDPFMEYKTAHKTNKNRTTVISAMVSVCRGSVSCLPPWL